MERLILTNGNVIRPTRIESGMAVVCRNGRIERILPGNGVTPEPGDRVIDARGGYIAPGFIDMHVHGGGGYDFMDGTVEAFLGVAETHARYGTTALVPTTLTCTDEELYRVFEVFREAGRCNKRGARLLGLHLEGPYFSHRQSGAQDPPYLKPPRREEYGTILEAAPEIIRWSVAPELDGALEMGRELRRRGILASVAHTDAVYDEVVRAHEAGYTHMTHLYSAMSSVTRCNARRYAGAVEAAYLIDAMTVEIIADGVHLPEALLRFVYKFKGADRTALCTDAMRGAGMPDGESVLGSLRNGRRVLIEEGVAKLPDRSAFAGSVATTDRLVRTMVGAAGVPLVEAVRMMSLTPARILGLDARKGSLDEGKDADIVVFDSRIHVVTTISEGHVLYTE